MTFSFVWDSEHCTAACERLGAKLSRSLILEAVAGYACRYPLVSRRYGLLQSRHI
jgi:hypothetical protein